MSKVTGANVGAGGRDRRPARDDVNNNGRPRNVDRNVGFLSASGRDDDTLREYTIRSDSQQTALSEAKRLAKADGIDTSGLKVKITEVRKKKDSS